MQLRCRVLGLIIETLPDAMAVAIALLTASFVLPTRVLVPVNHATRSHTPMAATPRTNTSDPLPMHTYSRGSGDAFSAVDATTPMYAFADGEGTYDRAKHVAKKWSAKVPTKGQSGATPPTKDGGASITDQTIVPVGGNDIVAPLPTHDPVYTQASGDAFDSVDSVTSTYDFVDGAGTYNPNEQVAKKWSVKRSPASSGRAAESAPTGSGPGGAREASLAPPPTHKPVGDGDAIAAVDSTSSMYAFSEGSTINADRVSNKWRAQSAPATAASTPSASSAPAARAAPAPAAPTAPAPPSPDAAALTTTPSPSPNPSDSAGKSTAERL